ncbi:DNA replication protein DnaD [Paenibacillus shirakamiensis]|uniref:DNA replication protein DnaD n=1 Tax=Paenibacillus shirakamiensis TaxID=1265935 RepID=A0ABS4JLE9_9BACL|nr:hypothetical protein [Paenibacillus shirakamiensis]MBP2002542.1 DNA replication protein DnaD [Paenibacillus shirakamiensis]
MNRDSAWRISLRRGIRVAALFLLGMIIGAVVYNTVFHYSFNQLWVQNKDLEIQLHQAEDEMKTMKKFTTRQSIIRSIKIRVEDRDPPLDSLAVKQVVQKLQEELEVMRGRSIFEIDTDAKMARTFLNRKVYTVRDKEYAVQIKTMLVSEGSLQIWIEVKPYVRS